MGLKEKQAMNDLQEKKIPKTQEYIKQHGLDIALKVKWDTFPTTGTAATGRCDTVLNTFGNLFWDFGQNKMAKDEISKKIKTVVIQHDGSITDPKTFKLSLNGTELQYTANLETATIANNDIKTKIEDML
jgi:hypothetical protein